MVVDLSKVERLAELLQVFDYIEAYYKYTERSSSFHNMHHNWVVMDNVSCQRTTKGPTQEFCAVQRRSSCEIQYSKRLTSVCPASGLLAAALFIASRNSVLRNHPPKPYEYDQN